MFTSPVQLTDVIYNAANQMFEATVTIYDQGKATRYACAIAAPITMSFADAAKGLKTKAQRLHTQSNGLASTVLPVQDCKLAKRRPFDPTKWLQSLLNNRNRFAA